MDGLLSHIVGVGQMVIPTDGGVGRAYHQGHLTLALSMPVLVGAFVALRLGWRWRQQEIHGAMIRALAPGLAYTLASGLVVAILWWTLPQKELGEINRLSMISFLASTGVGALAAWGVARRMLRSAPVRPDLDAQIALRLAQLKQQEDTDEHQ